MCDHDAAELRRLDSSLSADAEKYATAAVAEFAARIEVDIGYALIQLRYAGNSGMSGRVADHIQRALDALERVEERLAEVSAVEVGT